MPARQSKRRTTRAQRKVSARTPGKRKPTPAKTPTPIKGRKVAASALAPKRKPTRAPQSRSTAKRRGKTPTGPIGVPIGLIYHVPVIALLAPIPQPKKLVAITERERRLVEAVRKEEAQRRRAITLASEEVTKQFKKMRAAWMRKAHASHWNDIRPEWHAAKKALYQALGENYPEYAAMLNQLVLDAGLKWIVDYRPEQLTLSGQPMAGWNQIKTGSIPF